MTSRLQHRSVEAPSIRNLASTMRGAVLAAFAVAVAACGTTPPTHFHSLVGPEHPALREGIAGVKAPAFVLEPVRVPVTVDQPQWLLRLPDETLTLLEQERWASPLRDEFRSALLEQLTHRYGAIDARSGGAAASNPWRIAVDITRFESRPAEAWIESTWAIGRGGAQGVALRCVWSDRERGDGSMPSLAQAHRRAVAKLADAIGAQLVAIDRGEPGRCPS